MVLEQQKLSSYNEMLGRRQTTLTGIFSKAPAGKESPRPRPSPQSSQQKEKQPPSGRPAKRRRLSDPEDERREPADRDAKTERALVGGADDESGHNTRPASPRPRPLTIPDSDNSDDSDLELDEGELPSTQRTDIEQALPPIKTDREAIEEYEALRASESAANLQERLGNRTWVEGKSSIYVDAFNLALETVLEEESHLFDEAEMQVFEDWRALGYEGQYLYVRLFLRKTAAWFRINKLGYYSDIGNMRTAIEELFKLRALPKPSSEAVLNPGELEPPQGTVLGEIFTFADSSDEHITTLDEASNLLLLDELKSIAKDAKVQGKNKTELLRALRRTSGKQTGLGFASLKRSETEESVQSNTSESREDSPGTNRDEYYLRKILEETGQCIRLSPAAHKLFERVHLVFYRSTEWTEKSLTTIILARIARRNFPSYVVSRSSNIFPSRSLLLEFEASIRTQFRMDSILEFNGTPTKDGLQQVLDVFEEVLPRWRVLLAEEQRKEDSIYVSGEGSYLRRLSPAWVYTRIVHKGTYVLGQGKFKQHAREHSVICELLAQRLFHAARRGAWYQRKALLEEHYMGALSPDEGRNPDQQKKHWKKIALRTCEQGLQDNLVHLIYFHDLQKRIVKLERQLKVPKRQQHDFGHSMLAKPVERTFYGIRLERPPKISKAAPVSVSQRRLSIASGNDAAGANNNTRRGAKTLWLDPAGSSNSTFNTCPSDISTNPAAPAIVSVEAMCLSRYRALGWKGYHTEGGILRTLFALLFADILTLYLPNVFQTPYQTCPLDLHTDAFYPSRLSEINARLAEISNGAAESILSDTWDREHERRTCIVGLDWGFDVADLRAIVRAFDGARLARVMQVMCQEYAQRGGGVPDLFLWREDAEDGGEHDSRNDDGHPAVDVLFAEVKSENDRLSDTQRLWIHVLTDAGVRVELCNALASEVRVLES